MITLPREAKNLKKRVRTGKAVKVSRAEEVKYRRSLLALLKSQRTNTVSVLRLIAGGASKSEVSQLLSSSMNSAKRQFSDSSEIIAKTMVDGVAKENKDRTQKMIAKAFGVDWSIITNDPEIFGEMELRKTKNVSLIETIGSDYWGRVSQAVEDNYAGTLEKPLINTIAEIGGISNRKAKLIARDQTAKFASSLNEVRQRKNGISRYIWRTGQDERVVGNPSGIYPKGNKAHSNHFNREGKEFKWSEPPKDGHPGIPIQCRCTAAPVLDLDEMMAQFI